MRLHLAPKVRRADAAAIRQFCLIAAPNHKSTDQHEQVVTERGVLCRALQAETREAIAFAGVCPLRRADGFKEGTRSGQFADDDSRNAFVAIRRVQRSRQPLGDGSPRAAGLA